MLDVRIESGGNFVVVRLVGELAYDDAESLAARLESPAAGAGWRLAVDLSGVTYLGSAGLSALMNLVARSRLAGGRVILVAPSSFVVEVFQITRLDTWFEVCPTLDEAKTRFG